MRLFGIEPTLVETGLPSLNRISVGMPRTPNFDGVIGFSSMLTLAMVSLPSISPAISSSAGAICLHGPHHSAQQSTSTRSEDLSTSDSKEASVTLVGADMRSSLDWRCRKTTPSAEG